MKSSYEKYEHKAPNKLSFMWRSCTMKWMREIMPKEQVLDKMQEKYKVKKSLETEVIIRSSVWDVEMSHILQG